MIKKALAGGLLCLLLLCGSLYSLTGCGIEKDGFPALSASSAEESVASGGSEANGETTDANAPSGGESAEGSETADRETIYAEDGSFHTVEYHHDEQGNLTQADFYRQDGSFWYRQNYAYDENGRMIRQSTDGVVDFRLGYDGLGRTAFEVDYDDGHLQRYWAFTYDETGNFTESHIDFSYQKGAGYDGGDLAYGTRGGDAAVDVYFYPDGEVQRIVWYDENGRYSRDKDTFYRPEETPSLPAEE